MTLSPRTPRKGLRKTALKRGGRIKPKKRTPSEFRRIYGSKARVEWVKTLPCVAAHWGCAGGIENAHTENGGMSRKADYPTIVPACGFHHDEMHDGVQTFEARYRVDLKTCAAATQSAWLAHLDGAA